MQRVNRAKLIDVARDAGVSPATVSRAMNEPALLAEATLRRVRDSALRLGYRPDGAARMLASGRSRAIGAIVPTLDSAIFARALQSMQATLAREGYQLVVASHEMNPAAETEAIRTLMAQGVDGLMLVGAERAREARALLAASGLPVILTWCGHPDFQSVTIDNYGAGVLAARHLLDLGHRRIGVVVGHLHFNDRQRARLTGVRDALSKAGIALTPAVISEQSLTLAGGRTGGSELLEVTPRPTALIGGVDLLAIGCMQEAKARGIAIPSEISICGIDDIEMSAHLQPSLTSVHIPTAAIGEQAAMCLVTHLRSGAWPVEPELPIALVPRQSSAPAPS